MHNPSSEATVTAPGTPGTPGPPDRRRGAARARSGIGGGRLWRDGREVTR
ncbi:hypothetical protein ACFU9Y_34375 [Streptomyces sp. NPDC057621]